MTRNCSRSSECAWENAEYMMKDGSRKYCCGADYCDDQGMYEGQNSIHCYTCPNKICKNDTGESECMPGNICNVNH